MVSATYEIIALLMRYVFVALGVVMLVVAFRWMRRESREWTQKKRRLPDAGNVGELMDIDTGERFPLAREGMIGSGGRADIRLAGIPMGRTAAFIFEEGKGVRITPIGGRNILLDGAPLRSGAYALHGTLLEIGGRRLRVRLFAGLNVPRRAVYAEDEVMGVYDGDPGDLSDPEAYGYYGGPSDIFEVPAEGVMPAREDPQGCYEDVQEGAYAPGPGCYEDAPNGFNAVQQGVVSPGDYVYMPDTQDPNEIPQPFPAEAPEEEDDGGYQPPF